MYVYIYIYSYIYMCMHSYIHVRLCIYMHTHADDYTVYSVHLCVHFCVHFCVHVHVCACVCVWMCLCVCVCVCTCVIHSLSRCCCASRSLVDGNFQILLSIAARLRAFVCTCCSMVCLHLCLMYMRMCAYMRMCVCVCVRLNTLHTTCVIRAMPHSHTLQHTATHCNTLQHTAKHCTTLQHTAPLNTYIYTDTCAYPSMCTYIQAVDKSDSTFPFNLSPLPTFNFTDPIRWGCI